MKFIVERVRGSRIDLLLVVLAASWSLAGVYGLVLAVQLEVVLARFIVGLDFLLGPVSFLPAALLSFSQPKLGGIWLIAGGIVSVCIAPICIGIVNPQSLVEGINALVVRPLLLLTLPMVLFGVRALRNARPATRENKLLVNVPSR